MTLQQLIIHNIASIEHATIDFEVHPLADSEVFLITGKTGAGKSTILDAICLALYANTPRLDNTNMQGDTKDQDKDIKIKDPVQLMRRNTAEAFVALTFMGSNGIHYEATWSVARAHKKVTGKIQSKKWQLHNLDTDFTYNKEREIREEIARAIGLDFKQFCRTTLLAQGEFTRFLNSRDDDKAEILEKITGVDAYSKIGMKIFEKTSAMRKTWEEAQQKIAGITLLNEEEKASKNAELEKLAEQDKQIKANSDIITQKLAWIQEEAKLHAHLIQVKEDFLQAQAFAMSEEKKAEERLIKLWNSTIDARHWLQDINTQSIHIEQLISSLSDSKKVYLQIQGAYLYEQDAAEQIVLRKKQIDDFLQKEQPKVSLYENAQSIFGYMRLIEEGKKKTADYQNDIQKLKNKLQEVFIPQLTQAKDKLAEQQQALALQEENLLQENKTLEAFNLPSLRHQCDEKKALSNFITTAVSVLEQYKQEKLRLAQAQANLTTLSEDIRQKKQKAEVASRQVHDAEIEKNTAKAIYEKQRESINEWAKSIRIQLHIGDICPVCQQKVSSDLPHEESINALVAETAKAAKDAEQKHEKLMAEKNALEANILALSGQYKNDVLAFENGKNALKDIEQKLKNAFDACQLDTLLSAEDIQLHTTVEALHTLTLANQRIALQIENISHKISEAEAKEKQVKALQKAVEKLRKQADKSRETTTLAEKQKDVCEHEMANLHSLSASKEAEVKKAAQEATALTATQDWETSPLAYAQQILDAATLYNKNKEEKQKLENELTQRLANNENAATILSGILQYMPEWSSISQESVQKLQLDNLPERAARLQTHVASILSQIKTSQETLAQSKKLLDDFTSQHQIEHTQLKTLSTYSQASIAQMTQELDDAKQALSRKEAILKEAENAYKSHLANNSLVIDDKLMDCTKADDKQTDCAKADDKQTNAMQTGTYQTEELVLSLSSRLKELEAQQRELSDKRGGIMRDLEIDQVNQQKIGNLKKEEEAKKAEYNKWDRLNQLLGDATGNKFRRIAQSYILASLIHSANSYMRTLDNRYVLRVEPGTFVITMEDAYQSFSKRAASTLSGGESFLVSLSLALALSDIGNQLSVDTLFIDEGFGTLSGEPLQNAISTLRGLHTKSGRHVGIISHVEELKERIPVQIRVNQEGNNSSSTIEIVG